MELTEWFTSTQINAIFDIYYSVNNNYLSIILQDSSVNDNDEHELIFKVNPNITLTAQMLYDEIMKVIGVDNVFGNIVAHHPKIILEEIEALSSGIINDLTFKAITVKDAPNFKYFRGTKDKLYFRHDEDGTEIYLNLVNTQVYLAEEKYTPIDGGDGFTEKLIDCFYNSLKENLCTPF